MFGDKWTTLATYVLQGDAEQWGRMTQAIRFDHQEVISWNAFLKSYNEQYLLTYEHEKKKKESLML
jgi:hypothetical protein